MNGDSRGLPVTFKRKSNESRVLLCSQSTLGTLQLMASVMRQNRETNQRYLDRRSYRSYTLGMKIAISLPDALYEDAEQTARAMGIPRSQLFARAVSEFIKRHKREKITERLNEVYERRENQTTPEQSTEASIETMRELTRNDTW